MKRWIDACLDAECFLKKKKKSNLTPPPGAIMRRCRVGLVAHSNDDVNNLLRSEDLFSSGEKKKK